MIEILFPIPPGPKEKYCNKNPYLPGIEIEVIACKTVTATGLDFVLIIKSKGI